MNKIKAFFYGIISAFGATVFQQIFIILSDTAIGDMEKITPLLLLGALSEELFKFLVLFRLQKENLFEKEFFINSFLVGIGFSSVEIGLKLWGGFFGIGGLLGILFIHTITAGIIGYVLTFKKTPLWIFWGILAAFIVHIAYNSLILYFF